MDDEFKKNLILHEVAFNRKTRQRWDNSIGVLKNGTIVIKRYELLGSMMGCDLDTLIKKYLKIQGPRGKITSAPEALESLGLPFAFCQYSSEEKNPSQVLSEHLKKRERGSLENINAAKIIYLVKLLEHIALYERLYTEIKHKIFRQCAFGLAIPLTPSIEPYTFPKYSSVARASAAMSLIRIVMQTSDENKRYAMHHLIESLPGFTSENYGDITLADYLASHAGAVLAGEQARGIGPLFVAESNKTSGHLTKRLMASLNSTMLFHTKFSRHSRDRMLYRGLNFIYDAQGIFLPHAWYDDPRSIGWGEEIGMPIPTLDPNNMQVRTFEFLESKATLEAIGPFIRGITNLILPHTRYKQEKNELVLDLPLDMEMVEKIYEMLKSLCNKCGLPGEMISEQLNPKNPVSILKLLGKKSEKELLRDSKPLPHAQLVLGAYRQSKGVWKSYKERIDPDRIYPWQLIEKELETCLLRKEGNDVLQKRLDVLTDSETKELKTARTMGKIPPEGKALTKDLERLLKKRDPPRLPPHRAQNKTDPKLLPDKIKK